MPFDKISDVPLKCLLSKCLRLLSKLKHISFALNYCNQIDSRYAFNLHMAAFKFRGNVKKVVIFGGAYHKWKGGGQSLTIFQVKN